MGKSAGNHTAIQFLSNMAGFLPFFSPIQWAFGTCFFCRGAESRKLFKKKFARKDARGSGNSGRTSRSSSTDGASLKWVVSKWQKCRVFQHDISIFMSVFEEFKRIPKAKCSAAWSSQGSSQGNPRDIRRDYRKRGPARCHWLGMSCWCWNQNGN